mmetsp:Transcript_8907/g.6672  ORF Transcript_8907/g.6672 Transcript_8907/m.6672 type:complete len:147 (-) Transcript_8907:492-932(-)
MVERYNTGIVSDIGQRANMEDSYQCVQDLMVDAELAVTYYAVFDGHGGSQCANFLKENLHLELKRCFEDQLEGLRDAQDLNESISFCINKAFSIADNKFKQQFPEAANNCGATAVICLIMGNKLICANVGDARAILCRSSKALDLS